MGMDPMAMSQGMFGGFGGQGMGMNGMNMGMGYGGGYGGGWNGQQMSGNDFGGANAGYYPGGGYNQQSHQQGNFPQHQMNGHHNQQFAKNNFQNQNRFHGPGTHQQPKPLGQGQQGDVGAGPGQAEGAAAAQAQASGEDRVENENKDSAQQASDAEATAFEHQLPPELQNRRPSQTGSVEVQKETDNDKANDTTDSTNEAPKDEKTLGGDAEHGPNADNDDETNNAVEGPETQDGEAAQSHETAEVTVEGGHQQDDQQPGHGFQPQTFPHQQMGGFGNADPNSMGMNMGVGMGMGMDASFMGMSMPGMSDPSMGFGTMSQNFDYPGRGRGGFRGGYGRGYNNFRGGYGRGVQGPGFGPSSGFGGNVTVLAGGEPKGVGVEGAPTGPKAMREGLPNTGASGRLRGAFAAGSGRGVPHTGSAPPSEHQQR